MLNHVQLFVTLWTVAHQAPLSMRFPRQEYWLPNHSPLNLSEGWGCNSKTWPTLGLWKIMQARLGWDITCLSKEMKRCMPKSVNYDKVWEVTQEKDEGWSDHQEATQAQISASFVAKEGAGRRNVLNAPPVGCWKDNPNQPVPCNSLSNERSSCTDWWGQVSAHFWIPLNPSSLLHRVTLNVADRRTEYSVDTGTTCSVLTWPASPFSNRDYTETGVDRQTVVSPCLQSRVHYCYLLLFIYARMSFPLLGRVILNKLGATIF